MRCFSGLMNHKSLCPLVFFSTCVTQNRSGASVLSLLCLSLSFRCINVLRCIKLKLSCVFNLGGFDVCMGQRSGWLKKGSGVDTQNSLANLHNRASCAPGNCNTKTSRQSREQPKSSNNETNTRTKILASTQVTMVIEGLQLGVISARSSP